MLKQLLLTARKGISKDITKKTHFLDESELSRLDYFQNLKTIREVLEKEAVHFPNGSSPLAAMVVEAVTELEGVGGEIKEVPHYIKNNYGNWVYHYCNVDNREGIYIDMTLVRCNVEIPHINGICAYSVPNGFFEKTAHFFKPIDGDTKILRDWKKRDVITLDNGFGLKTYHPSKIIKKVQERIESKG